MAVCWTTIGQRQKEIHGKLHNFATDRWRLFWPLPTFLVCSDLLLFCHWVQSRPVVSGVVILLLVWLVNYVTDWLIFETMEFPRALAAFSVKKILSWWVSGKKDATAKTTYNSQSTFYRIIYKPIFCIAMQPSGEEGNNLKLIIAFPLLPLLPSQQKVFIGELILIPK